MSDDITHKKIPLTSLLLSVNFQVEIMKVLIDDHTIDPRQIAALTPYSAQREEIRKQMKKRRVNGVEVKTITESQGK